MTSPRSAIRAGSRVLCAGLLALLAAAPAVAGSYRVEFADLLGVYDCEKSTRSSVANAGVPLPFQIKRAKLEIDAVSACGGDPACDPPSGLEAMSGLVSGVAFPFTAKASIRNGQSIPGGFVIHDDLFSLNLRLGNQYVDGSFGCPSAPITVKKAVLIVTGRRVPSPWSRGQRSCTNALTRAFSKLVDVRARQMQECIGSGAQQKLSTSIEACVATDPKGKLAKAMVRTERIEAKSCDETLPDFGLRDSWTVNDAAPRNGVDVMRSVLGANLDLAVADESTGEEVSVCQQAVVKALGRWQKAKLKSFGKCQKQGLRGGSIQSAAELGECLGECLGEDPRDPARVACDPPPERVRAALEKRCQGVDLPEALPGIAAMPGCGTNDPAAMAACLDRSVECHTCLSLNDAEALERDCDELDDGALNGSCL